jgi:hypothetical protein
MNPNRLRKVVLVGVVAASVVAVIAPTTYAAPGPSDGQGSTLACVPNDGRCSTNAQCCSKTCIWCGQKNCCR